MTTLDNRKGQTMDASLRSEKHTAGPWIGPIKAQGDMEIIGASGATVAQIPRGYAERLPEREANARLIAAAPAMLALIARLSRTTVGHGCVPLEGNDGKSGLIGEARTLLASLSEAKHTAEAQP